MATTAPGTSLTEPWGLGDAVGGLLAGFLGSAVVAVILIGDRHGSLPEQFISNIPLWVAFVGVPIWATRRRGLGPRADLHLEVRPVDVVALVIGGVAQLVVTAAYHPFVSHRELERPARELADSAHGTGAKVLLVVMTVVIAPVAEELFYRGLILRAVRRRLPAWSAVAVVALAFAAMHFEPLQLPGLFVFGSVAGALCLWSDRLGPAVLAHVGFNAVALWQLHVI